MDAINTTAATILAVKSIGITAVRDGQTSVSAISTSALLAEAFP